MSPDDSTKNAAVHDWFLTRRSPVALAPRPIEPQLLAIILEAARWAPSSRNEQPWSFIVGNRDHRAAFDRLLGCLAPGNVTWAKNAGALILSVAKTTFQHNGSQNRHAWYDVGQATMSLVLQAHDLGIASHQMAGFDPELARRECGIPDGFEPVAMIALGYPGDGALLDDSLRARHTAVRTRRSLSKFLFDGHFGESLSLPPLS